MIIGFVILSVCADMLIGKCLVFSGRNEMVHPVIWTWYSTYLMLINLAKGVVHAIARIVTMLVVVITQVCMYVCMYMLIVRASCVCMITVPVVIISQICMYVCVFLCVDILCMPLLA